jgi:hypothetical protein
VFQRRGSTLNTWTPANMSYRDDYRDDYRDRDRDRDYYSRDDRGRDRYDDRRGGGSRGYGGGAAPRRISLLVRNLPSDARSAWSACFV